MRDAVRETLVTLGRGYVRNAPGVLGKAALSTHFLNAALRDHPRRRVVQTRDGFTMALDTQDLIQRYIYLFGVWEPHLTHWLRRRLRPGDTFIDVGANIGYFSLLAADLVGPTGNVVAIEAAPTFHRRLVQHVEMNGYSNVRAANLAVADRARTVRFILASSNNMGANSMVPYDGPAEDESDVRAEPLTDLLTANEVRSARIIKIDVEGAEGSVVRGLAPLLKQLRSDIEITAEVTPERMEKLGDSADELLRTMDDAGFCAYLLPNEYTPGSYPAVVQRSGVNPKRWQGPVKTECDVIFSRVDADELF